MADKATQYVIVAIDMEDHSIQHVSDTIEQIKDMEGVVAVRTFESIAEMIKEGTP